jgi:hypothetical protein
MDRLDLDLARHWGEKAGAELAPTCPYVRPALVAAWREGVERARRLRRLFRECK